MVKFSTVHVGRPFVGMPSVFLSIIFQKEVYYVKMCVEKLLLQHKKFKRIDVIILTISPQCENSQEKSKFRNEDID